MDRTKKECSRHPSPGTKPFCAVEIAPVSPAQQANRLAQMAAYTLYTAFCNEMGRQLPGNASSPFLKMRMVVLFSTRVLTQLRGRGCLWSTRCSAVLGASYSYSYRSRTASAASHGASSTVGLPRTCYSFYTGFPRTTVRTASAGPARTCFSFRWVSARTLVRTVYLHLHLLRQCPSR